MKEKIFIDAGFHVGSFTDGFLGKNLDFFCYAFEPNDLLLEKNKNIREKYKNRLSFSDKILWIEDTKMELTIGVKGMKGTSVLSKGNLSTKKLIKKAFDFSAWLQNNIKNKEHVTMKMDIEGSEYYVLPKIIKDGSIELVDRLIIEFHYHKMNDVKKYSKIHKEIMDFFSTYKGIELIKHTSWKDYEKKYY